MISYRFKRRAFMTAMSGGVGLKIMLRNMEAAAQTTKSPARLLVSHWPVGIVAGASDALFDADVGQHRRVAWACSRSPTPASAPT